MIQNKTSNQNFFVRIEGGFEHGHLELWHASEDRPITAGESFLSPSEVLPARVALILSGSPVSGSYDFEATFIGGGEGDLLPETDNPSILFLEPGETQVELRLGESFGQPKDTYLIGQEPVSINLNGTWLRSGSFPAIADDVTIQVSKPDGTIVFSRSLGDRVGEGFGGGWGRGTGWNQINEDGSFAKPGSYWAGVILTNPTYASAQEDYSKTIIFTLIDPTPPNAPSEWGRMAIVDTKPFKLRVILQRIFVERPQVTGIPAWPGGAACYRRSRYIL